MKKVSRIITTAALLGMTVVAASCAKKGGSGNAKFNFTFWTGFGSDYTRQTQNVVDMYNESHAGDVYLKHEKKGDYDSLKSQIMTSSGKIENLPHIACGYPDHFAEYWNKSILAPLDSFIERYDSEHGGDIISDYYTQYMRENKEIAYDDDGNPFTVGLPFNKSTEVMLCNGYLFDFFKQELAKESYTLEIPETWDKLREVSLKVNSVVNNLGLTGTDKNYLIGIVDENDHASNIRVSETANPTGNEKVLQDISKLTNEKKFYTLGYDSADNAFITIMHQWGIPYTEYTKADFERDMHGKAKFWNADNKAATKTAMEYFKTLNQEQAFGIPETFALELFCTEALESGRCLFTIGSSGGLNKPDFDGKRLDVYPILYKDATRKAVISQGTSIGMFNKFTTQEEYNESGYKAFCAMVELTTGHLQSTFVASTGYFPASKSAMDDEAYKKVLNNPTKRVDFLYQRAGQINKTVYDTENWDKFVDPGFVGSNAVRSAVKMALNNVFAGSVDTAMDLIWSSVPSDVRG